MSEDLFCTGDIEMLDFCMETYRRYIIKEPIAHNIFMNWDILSTFKEMKDGLFNFIYKCYFQYFINYFQKNQKLGVIYSKLNNYLKKI